MFKKLVAILFFATVLTACSKNNEEENGAAGTFKLTEVTLNGSKLITNTTNVGLSPMFMLTFEHTIGQQIHNHIELRDATGKAIPLDIQVGADGKSTTVSPGNDLLAFQRYTFAVRASLMATNGSKLDKEYSYIITTGLDPADKFERISTEQLLTKVQRQTFAYFWDFAHPAYGMIRERNTSGDIVTTGGTGFGLMAILVGIERGFITREQGLERTKKIVSFLKLADRYHGAFSHWYNGNTGKTQPFSTKDNGADVVETALLFQGLLTARNYFNDATLQADITTLYNAIEWSFFKNGQSALFWHWSPTFQWEMNLKVTGWNEALIAYILAAGSTTYGIERTDYEQGWANNGSIKNGASYYGIPLPLGPANGGPLFLSQYSFLGLNPFGLQDQYASYEQQVKNHTLINRAYCVANPKKFAGYSADCWGLTASDDIEGYKVHTPSDDNGVISPTAALSAMPYTPQESLQALAFFYYKLGDKIWGTYGFKDAFSLSEPWFADSYLAIDQGPILIGIENYRSGLLWKYFMQTPEIKRALQKLAFTTPNP
ncbi:glucoamylase family protein [Sphingobacterium suaedae]|uniref:Glucoamylase family protein n=1 Tax=Sphingobacterium suaedae TaxID=1686402 RepID=A0ABW5KEF3_9SPHI